MDAVFVFEFFFVVPLQRLSKEGTGMNGELPFLQKLHLETRRQKKCVFDKGNIEAQSLVLCSDFLPKGISSKNAHISGKIIHNPTK